MAAVNAQRIRYDAAVQLPRASEAAPDKVASLPTRQRVHAVSVAWEVFRAEKPSSWLVEGAVPSFEQAWEFVRDELINARRRRSLRIEGLRGGLLQTVEGYVRLMRDWLWLALFPGPMGVRSMSKGEWRSFWERLFARVKAEFSPGGQGRTAELLEQAAAQNGGTAAEALAAAEQSVAHRRAQMYVSCVRRGRGVGGECAKAECWR